MKLVDETGKQLNVGDEVKTFRGEDAVITGIYPPDSPGGGRGGRVGILVRDGEDEYTGVYFAGVINARFE